MSKTKPHLDMAADLGITITSEDGDSDDRFDKVSQMLTRGHQKQEVAFKEAEATKKEVRFIKKPRKSKLSIALSKGSIELLDSMELMILKLGIKTSRSKVIEAAIFNMSVSTEKQIASLMARLEKSSS